MPDKTFKATEHFERLSDRRRYRGKSYEFTARNIRAAKLKAARLFDNSTDIDLYRLDRNGEWEDISSRRRGSLFGNSSRPRWSDKLWLSD